MRWALLPTGWPAVPGAPLRTPAKRCPQAFAALFADEYRRRFGDGLLLKPNRTPIVVTHRPASPSFAHGRLLERKLDAHPNIDCDRKAKSATGLARPDFYDWEAEAKKQVEARTPDLVVVIMGGNDGQDLTPKSGKGKRVGWKSEGWNAAYKGRVADFLEFAELMCLDALEREADQTAERVLRGERLPSALSRAGTTVQRDGPAPSDAPMWGQRSSMA
mgnify:CR=1 FL=1